MIKSELLGGGKIDIMEYLKIPFSIKLGKKEYKSEVLCYNEYFFMMINLLEIYGKKQYDFMKRNKIIIDDDKKGLWKFIEGYFNKKEK